MIIARRFSSIKPLKEAVFREEMRKALENVRKDILVDYAKTTATWKNKPKFDSEIIMRGSVMNLYVGTDNDIYGYIDKGTKPYIIKAKTPKGLIFRTGGKPKTTPDVVSSEPGTVGDGWARMMEVQHPGIEPRNFTKWIGKTNKPVLKKEAKNALERFKRRSSG